MSAPLQPAKSRVPSRGARGRAEALHLAGRWAFRAGCTTIIAGRKINAAGMALCRVAGTLDGKADSAGYWRWHR